MVVLSVCMGGWEEGKTEKDFPTAAVVSNTLEATVDITLNP